MASYQAKCNTKTLVLTQPVNGFNLVSEVLIKRVSRIVPSQKKMAADRKTVWMRGVTIAATPAHCRAVTMGCESEPNEVDERKVRGYKMVKCGGSVRSAVGHRPFSLFM